MIKLSLVDRFIRQGRLLILISGLLVGCNSVTPPEPTAIPTERLPDGVTLVVPSNTPAFTPTPPPTFTLAPTVFAPPSTPILVPSFRPIITATPLPGMVVTAAGVAIQSTIPPAPTISCYTAKAGDTVIGIVFQGGYGDLNAAAAAFRQENGMRDNNIIVGSRYCLPARTYTPTPAGFDLTRTVQARILPTSAGMTFIEHTIKTGDTTLGLELRYGVPLGVICNLNPPPAGINCTGCKLDAGIGQAGCRVLIREGQKLRLPGPPPTPTITPTISRSETPTPTPAYAPPRLVAPEVSGTVNGAIRLRWLPMGGVLKADEVYMVIMTENTSDGVPRNFQYTTTATSFLVPMDHLPNDSTPHNLYWRVGVARQTPDGALILISGLSETGFFKWSRN